MKRLAILVVILAVLIGGYIFLKWYTVPDEFISPSDFHLAQWKQDNLDEIRMVFEGGKQLVLKKDNGSWYIDGFLADDSRITQFFEALSNANVTSRVSTNIQNHERFEVGTKGVEVNLIQNNEVIQKLIIGKSAGGESVYVRLPEQDPVYVLDNIPRYLISDDTTVWRNRKIVTVNAGEIRLVKFEGNNAMWQLNRTDEGFVLGQNSVVENVDVTKVDQWLNTLSAIQAMDFPTEETVPGKLVSTITIELGSVEEFSDKVLLQMYTLPEASQLLLTVNEDANYIINKDTLDNTFPVYTDMRERLKLEPVQPETAGFVEENL